MFKMYYKEIAKRDCDVIAYTLRSNYFHAICIKNVFTVNPCIVRSTFILRARLEFRGVTVAVS